MSATALHPPYIHQLNVGIAQPYHTSCDGSQTCWSRSTTHPASHSPTPPCAESNDPYPTNPPSPPRSHQAAESADTITASSPSNSSTASLAHAKQYSRTYPSPHSPQ